MEAELINSSVSAAQAFEKLGIIGIMFIVIVGLIYALGTRKKQDEKFTNALERIATASESQIEIMHEMNDFYKDVISRGLDDHKRDLNEVKQHVMETKTAQQQCLQLCNGRR